MLASGTCPWSISPWYQYTNTPPGTRSSKDHQKPSETCILPSDGLPLEGHESERNSSQRALSQIFQQEAPTRAKHASEEPPSLSRERGQQAAMPSETGKQDCPQKQAREPAKAEHGASRSLSCVPLSHLKGQGPSVGEKGNHSSELLCSASGSQFSQSADRQALLKVLSDTN